jgi:GR25 family glycosyltransferase involved in LPS biosynthesis
MKTRKNKMAVYWINLERSKERYVKMKEVLKDPAFDGMTKHRVEAIDGKHVTEKDIHSYFENLPKKYKINEICCLWSHLKALFTFSKSKYTYALILEDDTSLEFKPYWKETIQSCMDRAPSDWEVIQVSALFYGKPYPTKLYTNSKEQLYNCASAYLVCKKGVQRFLSSILKDKILLDKHIKYYADEFLFLKMNTYTYKYPLFTYTALDSNLHTDHIESIHLPNKKLIKKWLISR